MVQTNWYIWKYIVEFEQWWKERAEYWKNILKNISKDLAWKLWKWYSVQNLEYMRKFYSIFSDTDFLKSQSLIRKLNWTHIIRLLSVKDIDERRF